MSGRVLVTGAAGFVGSVLCPALEAQGYDVLRCDCVVDGEDATTRAFDLSDAASVSDMVSWALPVDYVIHLAAVTFVPEAAQDPTQVMDVNLNGTIRLLGALSAQSPETRTLFISSSEVYGPPGMLPVTEDHAFNPTNPYAISKAAADQTCRFFFESGGQDIVRMRPFNHSGPGQSDRFALSSFARQIAEIEAGKRAARIEVGNLEAARDFLHVDDVVRAYVLALKHGKAGEAYNLCSGTAQRLRDALDTLVGMSSAKVEVVVDEERLRPVDVLEVYGSCEKFSQACGWKPEISFEKLLEDLLNHWRKVV